MMKNLEKTISAETQKRYEEKLEQMNEPVKKKAPVLRRKTVQKKDTQSPHGSVDPKEARREAARLQAIEQRE